MIDRYIEIYEKELDEFWALHVLTFAKLNKNNDNEKKLILPNIELWGEKMCEVLSEVNFDLKLALDENNCGLSQKSTMEEYIKNDLPDCINISAVYCYQGLKVNGEEKRKFVRFNGIIILKEDSEENAKAAVESIKENLSFYIKHKKIAEDIKNEKVLFKNTKESITGICDNLTKLVALQNKFDLGTIDENGLEHDVWNELLQNANDKINDGVLEISVEDNNVLNLSYNEKTGFRARDYYAVITSGNSGNLDKDGHRVSETEGKKGTGFKSVYNCFNKVIIESDVKIKQNNLDEYIKTDYSISCELDRGRKFNIEQYGSDIIVNFGDRDTTNISTKHYPVPQFSILGANNKTTEKTTNIRLIDANERSKDLYAVLVDDKENLSESFWKKLLFLKNIDQFNINYKGKKFNISKALVDNSIVIKLNSEVLFSGYIHKYNITLRENALMNGITIPKWVDLNKEFSISYILQDLGEERYYNKNRERGYIYRYTTLPWNSEKSEKKETFCRNIYINNPLYEMADNRLTCYTSENNGNTQSCSAYNQRIRSIEIQYLKQLFEDLYNKKDDKLSQQLFEYSPYGDSVDDYSEVKVFIENKMQEFCWAKYNDKKILEDNYLKDICYYFKNKVGNDIKSKWILGEEICEDTEVIYFENIDENDLNKYQEKIDCYDGTIVLKDICDNVFTRLRTNIYLTSDKSIVTPDETKLTEFFEKFDDPDINDKKKMHQKICDDTIKLVVLCDNKSEQIGDLYFAGKLEFFDNLQDKFYRSGDSIFFSRKRIEGVCILNENCKNIIPIEQIIDNAFREVDKFKHFIEMCVQRKLGDNFIRKIVTEYVKDNEAKKVIKNYLNEYIGESFGDCQKSIAQCYLANTESKEDAIAWKKSYRNMDISCIEKSSEDSINIIPRYVFENEELEELDASIIERFHDRVDENIYNKEYAIDIWGTSERIRLEDIFRNKIKIAKNGSGIITGWQNDDWYIVIFREDSLGRILSEYFNCNEYITPKEMVYMDCHPYDELEGWKEKQNKEEFKKDLDSLLAQKTFSREWIDKLDRNSLKKLLIGKWEINNHEYKGYGGDDYADKRCPICGGILISEGSSTRIRNIQLLPRHSVPFLMCENCSSAVGYTNRVYIDGAEDDAFLESLKDNQKCKIIFNMYLGEEKEFETELSFFHVAILCKYIEAANSKSQNDV